MRTLDAPRNQWIGIEHAGPPQPPVAVRILRPGPTTRHANTALIDPAHYHRRTSAHRRPARAGTANEEDRAPKAPRLDPFRDPTDPSTIWGWPKEVKPADKPIPEAGDGFLACWTPGTRAGGVAFPSRHCSQCGGIVVPVETH